MDKNQCRRSSEYYASSIYEDDILSTLRAILQKWVPYSQLYLVLELVGLELPLL